MGHIRRVEGSHRTMTLKTEPTIMPWPSETSPTATLAAKNQIKRLGSKGCDDKRYDTRQNIRLKQNWKVKLLLSSFPNFYFGILVIAKTMKMTQTLA